MASTIAAVTTSGGGVVTTADASGNLNLLAGTTTVVALTTAGAAVSGTLSNTTGATFATSSGNVGIGGSPFAYGAGYVDLWVQASTTPVLDLAVGSTRTGTFYASSTAVNFGTVAAVPLILNTSNTERMRIDSAGNVLIGTTTGNADARLTPSGGSTDSSPCIDFSKGSSTTTTSQVYARFFCNNNATATGSITANGVSAATFTGYSDRRLKENITDLPSQLANIMALRPVEFDFKGYEPGEGHQIGFIAQDVQLVYPDVVGEGTDGMLTLSDMNKNDARLIKCIQEQQALILALTDRIAALEAK